MNIVTFPAGRYLIGDLCYRDDEMWDRMISFTKIGTKGTVRNSYEGIECDFCILPTQHGDGGYQDQFGNEYGVDSGTIGIMSYPQGKQDSSMGRTFEFDGPFQVYKEGAKLVFGSIIIDTDVLPVSSYVYYDDNGVDYEESDNALEEEF